ncbi:MAG: LLM class flavin-dependent oxidoreductase [Chloroflexi bacterium]|nr:LLM class flavin-dependent oxidoreductase [Chloroflexota bacterium]
MSDKRIGVAAMGGDASAVLARIQELERLGMPAAWLTTGGAGLDALTLFAAAAVRTERILLGTCITPTWPRHPIVAAQQVQVVGKLAPGRFRLGVGPSHKAGMERTFGVNFQAPLTNLREYVHIVKTLLQQGAVDFDGRHYHAHARIPEPISGVPVMASALRRGSFLACGAEADGAISWVCPGTYLRDVALPAMRQGAQQSGRPVPPLIAHAPVCVHDNASEVRAAAKEQLANYPANPFYTQMLVDAGFPEVAKTKAWNDAMLEAVVLSGKEEQVTRRLKQLFDLGASEIIVSVVTAGANPAASWQRTVRLLAEAAKGV